MRSTLDAVWIWGIFGLVLLSAELATGTLYILWFGLAALIISALLWLFPGISLAAQLLLFAGLSLSTLLIWKKFERSQPASRLGQAQGEEIGRTGQIVVAVSPEQCGRIRFTQGVMGSKEWTAISSQPLALGEEAEITSIEGNALRVKKSGIAA
jgi:inner membrane protein